MFPKNISAIPRCSKSNEIFEPNKNFCLETCRSFYRLVPKPPCIPSPPFPLGCKCLPGSVRNDNNDCVKTSDCRKFISVFKTILLYNI